LVKEWTLIDDTDLADLMTEIPLMPHRQRDCDTPIDESRTVQKPLPPTRGREILSALGSVLYAMRLQGGVIKIGYTTNLQNRVYKLKSQELLAFRFGDRRDEAVVHRSLSAHVAHGREYYHPHPQVIDLINSWRADLGMTLITP
jgi:Meiotically up-regulated gene 113